MLVFWRCKQPAGRSPIDGPFSVFLSEFAKLLNKVVYWMVRRRIMVSVAMEWHLWAPVILFRSGKTIKRLERPICDEKFKPRSEAACTFPPKRRKLWYGCCRLTSRTFLRFPDRRNDGGTIGGTVFPVCVMLNKLFLWWWRGITAKLISQDFLHQMSFYRKMNWRRWVPWKPKSTKHRVHNFARYGRK